jgi:hypothetical protein
MQQASLQLVLGSCSPYGVGDYKFEYILNLQPIWRQFNTVRTPNLNHLHFIEPIVKKTPKTTDDNQPMHEEPQPVRIDKPDKPVEEQKKPKPKGLNLQAQLNTHNIWSSSSTF